jgi:alkanesulfonate monooxygenase SsuD/methylene tetrahydromethanopterin reductase-like flavin-dependent oxidoreductase (luciferase family)
LVEGIVVIRALWTGAPASYQGRYYQVRDAYCEPRPEPVPPIMIGGDGERYLLRAVAEQADWWLPYARGREVLAHKIDVLKRHCQDVGRDYGQIRKAYTCVVHLDRDRAAAQRRADARPNGQGSAFAGDPASLREYLSELVELGYDHYPLVFPDFPETDDLDLFVDEVLPHFR